MPSSHPDADLHPVATGPAAKIVAEHQSEQPLKLYSGWFCPFVQRSWIVLEEKNISYQYVEINPYHKDPSFLKLNPRGLVPTLACPQPDGSSKPLIESNVICEFLDEISSNQSRESGKSGANGVNGNVKGRSLFPEDKYEKARMKVWIDFVGTRIIPAFHRFLQHTPEKNYSIADARKELLEQLKKWIAEADSQGPFFAGKEMMMADVTLAPWAVRLWTLDHFKEGGLGIPEKGQGGEDEALWERWRKWVNAVKERKSVRETMSDQEHYMPIYTRYAEDRAQSELAKATRSGRGVP